MDISKGLKLIKKWEGCKLYTYDDYNDKRLYAGDKPKGVPTIGWGMIESDYKQSGVHVWHKGKPNTITQAVADSSFEKLIKAKYVPKVDKYHKKYKWNVNQYCALLSFAYNIGSLDGLTANGTRSNAQIAKKIMEYCNYQGKPIDGLVARRKDEQELFETKVKKKYPICKERFLIYLEKEHKNVKKYGKYFKRDADVQTTFAESLRRAKAHKETGISCCYPFIWYFRRKGVDNALHAVKGSYKDSLNTTLKKYLKRLTKGEWKGHTLKYCVKHKLLQKGDLIAFEGATHSCVYAGGYKVYDGGGQTEKLGYTKVGIKPNYAKGYYKDKKISEILRWKV